MAGNIFATVKVKQRNMAKSNIIPDEADRIRANTSEEYNAKIDRFTENNIRFYATQSKEMISERIDELEDDI